jgi:deoxyribonuclease-4
MRKRGRCIPPIRLGVHVSILGGIEKAVLRARELGCSAMQIFSRNPRGWNVLPLSSRAIRSFQQATASRDIDPIVVHTPYLINLATPDDDLYKRSTEALALDLNRAAQIGARYVVTHLGSAGEKGKGYGEERVVRALKVVLSQAPPVTLLLENSAGGGKRIGGRLEEIHAVIAGVEAKENKKLGVCFDTCHGYSAGYDFGTPEKANGLAEEVKRTIGPDRLFLLHLNDCAGKLGAHLDRHEHIGRGRIGLPGFRNLLAHPDFQGIPMILETPKENPEDDRKNLLRIRRICQRIEARRQGRPKEGSIEQ